MSAFIHFWDWLTSPSDQLLLEDQRRQARLLASLILITILLAVIEEALTIADALISHDSHAANIGENSKSLPHLPV